MRFDRLREADGARRDQPTGDRRPGDLGRGHRHVAARAVVKDFVAAIDVRAIAIVAGERFTVTD